MNGIYIENYDYILSNLQNICDNHIILTNNNYKYSIYGYEIINNSEDW